MSLDINYINAFWSRIMKDHLKVLDERLAETEAAFHQRVHQLGQLNVTQGNASTFLKDLIKLKVDILDQEVNGSIKLAENPVTISDMLNEAHEYKRLVTGESSPARNPTNSEPDIHKLWLNDIIGHLGIIICGLDGATSVDLRMRIKKMKKTFVVLRDENMAFIEYILNGVFPAAAYKKFNEKVIAETVIYLAVLEQLFALRKTNQVLGSLAPEFIDHMYREQCYYLVSLGVSEFKEKSLNGLM